MARIPCAGGASCEVAILLPVSVTPEPTAPFSGVGLISVAAGVRPARPRAGDAWNVGGRQATRQRLSGRFRVPHCELPIGSQFLIKMGVIAQTHRRPPANGASRSKRRRSRLALGYVLDASILPPSGRHETEADHGWELAAPKWVGRNYTFGRRACFLCPSTHALPHRRGFRVRVACRQQ